MRFWNVVYNWQDAAYTLSRGAVDKLYKVYTKEGCESGGKYWKNGDWYLGKHTSWGSTLSTPETRERVGSMATPSRNFSSRGCVRLERYWKDSLYLSEDGPRCCSNNAVSFHGILSNSKMYQLEYLSTIQAIYKGGVHGNKAAAPAPHYSPPPLMGGAVEGGEELMKVLTPSSTPRRHDGASTSTLVKKVQGRAPES